MNTTTCPGYGPPCGRDTQGERYCDECAVAAQADMHIRNLHRELCDRIASAIGDTSHADAHLRELVSDGVYDIDLAECSDGHDAARELKQAARHLRNASRTILAHVRECSAEVEPGPTELERLRAKTAAEAASDLDDVRNVLADLEQGATGDADKTLRALLAALERRSKAAGEVAEAGEDR